MTKLLTLTLLICGTIFGQGAITGFCQDGAQRVSIQGAQSQQYVQRSYPACTVRVYEYGTTNLATIYSDGSSTPLVNPFTADSNGMWSFFATDANYTVQNYGAGIVGTVQSYYTISGSFGSLVSTTPIANGIPQAFGTALISPDWVPTASASQKGVLLSADWTTFNAKVSATRSISTTAPLAGGGDLSANRTFSITQSTTSTDGYLSSTDWNTFNNKVPSTRSISTTSPLAGGGDLSANRTFSVADAAADGSTKGAATFTASDFNATSGLISIDYTNGQSASAISKGFLTAADWITFNSAASGGITALTGDVTATGPGSSAATLATVASPGTNLKITYNAKGLVTSGATAACGDLSNAAASCSTDATNASNIAAGTLGYARLPDLAGMSYCGSGGGSPATYVCTTGDSHVSFSTYAAGFLIVWKPDVNGSGGATTLNVNSLGAKAIKLRDGSTNPTSIDIVADQAMLMEYDGVSFRILAPISQFLPQSVTSTGLDAGTTTFLQFRDGGLTLAVRSRPNAESKRVLFLGSSTCAGAGATTYAASWPGLLTAAMSGYTFINQSISGNSTADLISRFYTDAAPWHPDFVILCSSLYNEGFPATPAASAATYKTNTYRLIKMIEGIGAIPVFMGQIANDNYDAAGCKILYDLYDWQNSLGLQVFDGIGATVDPAVTDCAFLSGASSDGIHPNDTYHAAIYATVLQTYFDQGRAIRVSPQSFPTSSWIYGSDTSNSPFDIAAPSALRSWTVTFWSKDNATGSKAFFYAAGSTGPLRIRNPSDIYELIQTSDTITSSVSTLNKIWHHQAITYHYPTKTLCYFIDGVLIDTCKTAGTQFAATSFTIMGRADSLASNCSSCQVAQIGVWQSNLSASDVKDVFNGRFPIKSLFYYAPLSEQPRTNPYSLASADSLGVAFSGTNGFTYGIPFAVPYLAGRTAAIGGGALVASCASGTATVTGAATEMQADASPEADITSGNTVAFAVQAYVSSANTVTVRVCGTGTPTSTNYRVRVTP